MHGRDSKYRPIMVIKVGKLNELDLEVEEAVRLTCYFCDYLVNKMMLDGQVETLVCVCDLDGVGVTNLPFSVKS